MVELRKRKTPPPAPVRPAKKAAAPKTEKPKETKAGKAKAAVVEKVAKVKEAVTGKKAGAKANGSAAPAAAGAVPKVGDRVDLKKFEIEVETNDGTKTSLVKLLQESKSGVILFTYPKASTSGCTKQVCFFRDSFTPLTATGFDIYGLSNDSPKSNTTFKTKQNLPYPLLCDPSRALISAIGLKKEPNSTTRGVFIIDKAGQVLAAESGSPDGTVEVARKIVAGEGAAPATEAKEKEDAEVAKTAGEVADTAAKIDA